MRDRMERMWTFPNIYERQDGTHVDFSEHLWETGWKACGLFRTFMRDGMERIWTFASAYIQYRSKLNWQKQTNTTQKAYFKIKITYKVFETDLQIKLSNRSNVTQVKNNDVSSMFSRRKTHINRDLNEAQPLITSQRTITKWKCNSFQNQKTKNKPKHIISLHKVHTTAWPIPDLKWIITGFLALFYFYEWFEFSCIIVTQPSETSQ